MLPTLRLVVLTLAGFLLTASAAHAANSVSVAVPAEGQVAVTVATGVKSVKGPRAVPGAGGRDPCSRLGLAALTELPRACENSAR